MVERDLFGNPIQPAAPQQVVQPEPQPAPPSVLPQTPWLNPTPRAIKEIIRERIQDGRRTTIWNDL
jgi:hypothetical protein